VFKEKIDEKYLNIDEITKRIEDGEDIIGRNERYNSIKVDNRFPDFIINNKDKYFKWLVKD
jgi:hypothetical protein